MLKGYLYAGYRIFYVRTWAGCLIYRPYFEKDGRKKLAEAVKLQVNCEGKELVTVRKRTQTKHEKVIKTINNLLDNLTETNREYVDQRLNELIQQKQQLETRLEELDRLYLSQAEIDSIVTDSMQFLSDQKKTIEAFEDCSCICLLYFSFSWVGLILFTTSAILFAKLKSRV